MATISDPWPLSPADLGIPQQENWLRITAERFSDPLGWGPGESRFVPPRISWGGIYMATDVVTAFREGVVRDRAIDPKRPPLLLAEDLTDYGCVGIAVPRDLRLVDLIDGRLSTLLDTDERSGRTSQHPGGWAEKWRQDPQGPEGIRYPSRFTGRPCLFVFDHALPKLHAEWRRRLDKLPDPHGAELARYIRGILGA